MPQLISSTTPPPRTTFDHPHVLALVIGALHRLLENRARLTARAHGPLGGRARVLGGGGDRRVRGPAVPPRIPDRRRGRHVRGRRHGSSSRSSAAGAHAATDAADKPGHSSGPHRASGRKDDVAALDQRPSTTTRTAHSGPIARRRAMSRRRRARAARGAGRRPLRERTQPVGAILADDELLVLNCPYCGRVHCHGAADEAVGSLTPRTAHCARDARPYVLRVVRRHSR